MKVSKEPSNIRLILMDLQFSTLAQLVILAPLFEVGFGFLYAL